MRCNRQHVWRFSIDKMEVYPIGKLYAKSRFSMSPWSQNTCHYISGASEIKQALREDVWVRFNQKTRLQHKN